MGDRVGWSGASLGMPAALRPPWGEARLAGRRGQGWVTPHCSLQKEPDCSPLQCGRQHSGLMEQLLSLGILNSAVKPSWRCERLVSTCMPRLPQGLLGSWWESRKTSFCCVFLYHTSQMLLFFFLNKLKVCDSSPLSDDGYHFFLAIWQSSLFLMNVCSVFLDIDRLQYSVHIHFYMHWETEKKIHVTCFIAIFTLL